MGQQRATDLSEKNLCPSVVRPLWLVRHAQVSKPVRFNGTKLSVFQGGSRMRNRSEVLAAYHAYLDAFVASDEDAIHA